MSIFRFKQFQIHQDKCAMKIGTDGVLLGAWASLPKKAYNILDIGAGTGIIALMLAQRSNAENIEAIELNDDAYEQCVENFENSDWRDRLFCFHASFDEFVHEYASGTLDESDLYDVIVSNPPFYAEEVSSGTIARDNARQNSALPFEELISGVAKLLGREGVFSTIIPFKEEENFILLAENQKLFPNRITRVKGTKNASFKRSLLAFSFKKMDVLSDELIIEMERNVYTNQYIALTKDFYLKM